MNESQLIEKLRRLQALAEGGATEGECVAATKAKERIEARLRALEHEDPPQEFRFTMNSPWSRRAFLALLRRYGIEPYRYPRQRRTSVMARMSKRFCDEILWPEFVRIDDILASYLDEVADRVLRDVLQSDSSDAAVVAEPQQLPFGEA